MAFFFPMDGLIILGSISSNTAFLLLEKATCSEEFKTTSCDASFGVHNSIHFQYLWKSGHYYFGNVPFHSQSKPQQTANV